MGKKLYVGNLSTNVTEVQLHEFFSVFGPVVSVRIKRDSVTGESWGYGFVEMGDPGAAEAALQGANGKSLGDRKLRIDSTRLQ